MDNENLKQDISAEEPEANEPVPSEETSKQEDTLPSATVDESSKKEETKPPDLSAELKSANERAESAEQKAEVLGMGVKLEAVADVITLAKTRQNDKTTFQQAVAAVLEAYKDFKVTPPFTTGTRTTGDDTHEDDAQVRKTMGLPPIKNN